ncbi:VOC family protein [Verrucomicrobium spinosum]|uniref:VOC family protein n=1 Tax=Verrucomicrobium spinosum TaxID=2736 RepID=UPI0012E19181|nr:hypothetical protein [Verrucomicrobium spinosum]
MDDAAAACGVIEVAGGSIVEPPVQREGEPIKLGRFADPAGNLVMLTEYLG